MLSDSEQSFNNQ